MYVYLLTWVSILCTNYPSSIVWFSFSFLIMADFKLLFLKHYWKYVRQFDIFGARKVMYSDSLFLPTTLSESLKLYYKVKKGGPYFPTIEIMRNMFYCCKKIFRLFKFIMKNEKLYNSRCFPLILLQVQQMARYIALILYQTADLFIFQVIMNCDIHQGTFQVTVDVS